MKQVYGWRESPQHEELCHNIRTVENHRIRFLELDLGTAGAQFVTNFGKSHLNLPNSLFSSVK